MTVEAECAAICANLVAKPCSANPDYTTDACMTDCADAQVEAAECPDEFAAWLTCNAAQPASSWICTEDGETTLMAGLCEIEESSLTTCLVNG